MALNLMVWELFAQVPSGWRSLGYFESQKKAEKQAKLEPRNTLIEKKLI